MLPIRVFYPTIVYKPGIMLTYSICLLSIGLKILENYIEAMNHALDSVPKLCISPAMLIHSI